MAVVVEWRRRWCGSGDGVVVAVVVERVVARVVAMAVVVAVCSRPSGPKPEIQHDQRGRGMPTLT